MTRLTTSRSLLASGALVAALTTAACGTSVPGSAAPAPDGVVSRTTESSADPAPSRDPGSEESTTEGPEDGTTESSEPAAPTAPAEPSDDDAPPPSEDIEAFHAWVEAGALSYDTARATMDITMNGADFSSTTMAFDQTEKKLWMETVTSIPGTPSFDMNFIVVGGECWLSSEFLFQQLGVVDGEWLAVDESDPMLAAFASSCDESAWTQSLGITAGGFRSVEEIGPAEVDGVPAMQFEVVLDSATLAELGGAETGAVLEDDLPADLYLDENGRLLKMAYEMAVEGQEVEMELKMTGFDEPVDIQAPSPDEIGTLPG